MNDENFKQRIVTAVRLLLMFRQETDLSEKRILREAIRAIVKELTRV